MNRPEQTAIVFDEPPPELVTTFALEAFIASQVARVRLVVPDGRASMTLVHPNEDPADVAERLAAGLVPIGGAR